jgi:hypothetical protein
MTPKQRVLKKIPTAYATPGFGFYAGLWVIRELEVRDNVWSNHQRTAAAAWADAAKRLSTGPHE